MSKTLYDLLAIDEAAQRAGCGLHPRLRAAINADLSFHSKMAGPIVEADRGNLRENVTAFPGVEPKASRKA